LLSVVSLFATKEKLLLDSFRRDRGGKKKEGGGVDPESNFSSGKKRWEKLTTLSYIEKRE